VSIPRPNALRAAPIKGRRTIYRAAAAGSGEAAPAAAGQEARRGLGSIPTWIA
jgi:hypothetical protein